MGKPITEQSSDWEKRHAEKQYYKDGERWEKWSVEQSATAEIRRLEKRLESIKETAEICKQSGGWKFEGGRIELNTEDGRIQAYFDEIPSEEIRTALKRNSWHWSRNAGAWQKMLNPRNIRYTKESEIFKPIEESTQAEEIETVETVETVAEEKPEEVTEQAKASKKTKKPERKTMTVEELQKELDRLSKSDEWRTDALLQMLFRKQTNSCIIMQAGIESGAISFEEFADYIKHGAMPHYHTYAEWKKMGRQVKQGEKALFKARIWRYTEKHGTMTAEHADTLNTMIGGDHKEGDETIETGFIKKESFFFGIAQTEKTGEIKKFEIGKTYKTNAGNITVTDRTETELTFTAAVNRKSYTKEIQTGKKCEFVKINKAGITAQATNEIEETKAEKKTVKTAEKKTATQEKVEKKPETKKENNFEVGKCYFYDWQVYSRTAKTVTLKNIFDGTTKRHKVTKVGDCEQITLADGVKMRALATMAKTLQENLTEFIRVTENIMKNPNYRDSSDEDGKLEQAKKC